MRKESTARNAALTSLFLLIFASNPATAQQSPPESAPSSASPSELSEVRLFNSWSADAVFTPGIDLEPIFDLEIYDGANRWFGGARTAFWVSDGVEVGGRIGWAGIDPDGAEGDSSFGDLDLFGRFRLPVDFAATVAAGTELRLPTGSASAGQDDTIVRIFGALRKDIDGAFTLTANLGFEYVEVFQNDGNGIALGLGSLVPVSDELTATFEFNLRTAYEYAMVTGGLDYKLPPGGHLRGAVGVGLDQEAPDAQFQISLALPVF